MNKFTERSTVKLIFGNTFGGEIKKSQRRKIN